MSKKHRRPQIREIREIRGVFAFAIFWHASCVNLFGIVKIPELHNGISRDFGMYSRIIPEFGGTHES